MERRTQFLRSRQRWCLIKTLASTMPDDTRWSSALPAVSRIARAQAYPSRPVRIIVPFAPAGSTDIVARLIRQWLSERLGQQFVIDNRPGGGGNIGTEAVVRAPADGYTLLLVGGFNAINATLYEKLNYNFIRDITPVASATLVPGVMEVNPLFQPRRFPSSSPMRRPIRARSAWRRVAPGARHTFSASCSR
jgi:hypothetical protein